MRAPLPSFPAALVVVAALALPAQAGDPGPVAPVAPPVAALPRAKTPEQAADAVLAAVEAKDVASLHALAVADDPDPWIVADELAWRGAWDAARAYAGSAPRKAVSQLVDHLAARRSVAPDEKTRSTIRTVAAAVLAKHWERVLEATEGTTSPLDSVAGLRVAYGRGLALVRLGRSEEGVRSLTEVADAARQLGWFARAIAALHEIGGCEYDRAHWNDAFTAWEARRALATEIGDRSRAAQAVGNLGLVHFALGDLAKALTAYEQALAEHRSLGDSVNAGRTLVNVGNVYKARGEFAQAIPRLDRAIEELERAGDKAAAAGTRSSLGGIYRSLGDPARAVALQTQALTELEALGDRAGAARTRANLGASHLALGDELKALTLLERARAELDALGLRADVATALGSIASVHFQFGRYSKAITGYQRALDEQRSLRDRVGAAISTVGLAHATARLGDGTRAISLLMGALREQRALGDRSGAAATLSSIGVLQFEEGETDLARGTYEEALAAHRALGEKADAAHVVSNLALVHERAGDRTRALAFHAEALESLLAVGDRVAAARTLANAGRVHRAQGELTQAVTAYERALALLHAAPDSDARVFALWGLGVVRMDQGDFTTVARLAREAIEITSRLSHGLAEGEGAATRDVFAELFELGTRAALELGDTGQLAWFLEQGRSGSLREALGSRAGLESAVIPAALRHELGRARAAERQALDAYRGLATGANLDAVRAAMKAWEDAKSGVEVAFARIEREAKAAASVTMGATDDEARLRTYVGEHEVLVLYGFAGKTAVALIVSASGSRAVRLPGRVDIEAAARALLADDDRHVVPGAALALRALIVEPLGLGPEVRRVLVSPTGILGYVPFALLWPDRETANVPSGTTYGLLLASRALRGERVLALGDPDYGDSMSSEAPVRFRGGAFGRLSPLPATRIEVKGIGDTTLLGAAASETGFTSAITVQPRWRAVHLACHGLIDPERPMFSSLALSADSENDGFLTAIELFQIKVPADLVVMSACETGKGKIFRTEGIVGLTRAFMFAGAPRVICSLWKVDDEATRALMTKFYELWNPQLQNPQTDSTKPGTAEALRKAQEFVRSQPQWAHPRFWAAWVLWGLPE